MDEDNAPMAFPNGYVYSREVRQQVITSSPPFSALNLVYFILLITWNNGQALEEMSAQNEGRVKCPRTQEECEFFKLKKVFIS
jgi:macrophage erythroblast attacher